jgi:tripartite-type tricarboxylate transporter receptor subunit TctC
VVPFPAGGGNDALARAVAEQMSRTLGQQVVVENRARRAAAPSRPARSRKAAPDGYTILLTYTGTFAVNPTPLSQCRLRSAQGLRADRLIGAHAERAGDPSSLPVHSTAELIAYAKANPSKINYASCRHDRPHHHRVVREERGIELTSVPYKGNGDALGNLIGGTVRHDGPVHLADHRQREGGHLPALARDHGERSQLLPDVPPIRESALPASRPRSATGSAAPPARRADHRAAEQGAARGAASDESARELAAEGAEPFASTPEEYAPRSTPTRPSGRHRQKPQPENRVA